MAFNLSKLLGRGREDVVTGPFAPEAGSGVTDTPYGPAVQQIDKSTPKLAEALMADPGDGPTERSAGPGANEPEGILPYLEQGNIYENPAGQPLAQEAGAPDGIMVWNGETVSHGIQGATGGAAQDVLVTEFTGSDEQMAQLIGQLQQRGLIDISTGEVVWADEATANLTGSDEELGALIAWLRAGNLIDTSTGEIVWAGQPSGADGSGSGADSARRALFDDTDGKESVSVRDVLEGDPARPLALSGDIDPSTVVARAGLSVPAGQGNDHIGTGLFDMIDPQGQVRGPDARLLNNKNPELSRYETVEAVPDTPGVEPLGFDRGTLPVGALDAGPVSGDPAPAMQDVFVTEIVRSDVPGTNVSVGGFGGGVDDQAPSTLLDGSLTGASSSAPTEEVAFVFHVQSEPVGQDLDGDGFMDYTDDAVMD